MNKNNVSRKAISTNLILNYRAYVILHSWRYIQKRTTRKKSQLG